MIVSVVSKFLSFSTSLITFSQTNQRLTEWRNGFTYAATSALISLFVSDTELLEYKNRVAFASGMAYKYRFLYADALSQDPMVRFASLHSYLCWKFSRTGMACGVAHFFLQVFASQINSTTSRVVDIPELHSENQNYIGAMALVAAAVGGFSIVVCE